MPSWFYHHPLMCWPFIIWLNVDKEKNKNVCVISNISKLCSTKNEHWTSNWYIFKQNVKSWGKCYEKEALILYEQYQLIIFYLACGKKICSSSFLSKYELFGNMTNLVDISKTSCFIIQSTRVLAYSMKTWTKILQFYAWLDGLFEKI